MTFYADLHIHSKYSRATSKDCDLQNLAYWARRKGITVVGTGDFTHPAWRAELKDNLLPAEPGLFRLRPDLERAVDEKRPYAGPGGTRFMLSVEISTIYKKGDKTRKVHHLLFAPDFQAVDRLVASLAKIGNLASDGRPILGLDSRHLLEITLASGPHSFLIPAHVWTPWFAALGSKSGFDSIVECYGDLAEHIFAIETGLSSDPAMNWRLSQLDRYTLVSNSDAHSPPKLGREVNRFECDLSYFAILEAMRTRVGFAGTVEFFPEEGKYHMDGHRKCGVVLAPEETRTHGGRCPVCKRPLTVGVMHRVQSLADRPTGFRPETASPFRSLIPLPEVIAEIVGVGPTSKTVSKNYNRLLATLGSELHILESAPVDELARAGVPELAEAVTRMRAGQVIRQPGYDGEYGVIRVFADDERRSLGHGRQQMALLPLPGLLPDLLLDGTSEVPTPETATPPLQAAQPQAPTPDPVPADDTDQPGDATSPALKPPIDSSPALAVVPDLHTDKNSIDSPVLAGLDPEQRAAATITDGPLLIIAGPGTGKTRTLTHRIAHLVADCQALPEACLAVTFTNRAAAEMRERMVALLPAVGDRIPVTTFHALALSLLREHRLLCGLHRGFRIATDRERARLLAAANDCNERVANQLLGRISTAKRTAGSPDQLPGPDSDLGRALTRYQAAMSDIAAIDFDDVLLLGNRLLADNPGVREHYREHYQWISIDEYQDIDELQYQLVRHICPDTHNLCAIGDPDQAIYRFRGADVGFFLRFEADFPGSRRVELTRNYRSSKAIIRAALQAIAPTSLVADRRLHPQRTDGATHIATVATASAPAEAEFVVHTIEQMLGGTSFFSLDSGRVASGRSGSDRIVAAGSRVRARKRANAAEEVIENFWPDDLAFSDIAVLYRSGVQIEPLRVAFARSGVPFQHRSHGLLTDQPGVEELLAILHGYEKLPTAWAPRSLDEALVRARDEILRQDGKNSADTDDSGTVLGADAIDRAYELLVPLALRCGTDAETFFAEVACDTGADAWDARADRVSLLTMHAAKGLEFRVVFLVGCEDGLTPLRFGQELSPEDAAEERRLFFVAITRAKELLYMTRAERRLRHGQVRDTELSPFVRAIASALKRPIAVRRGGKRKETRRRQLGLF